MARKDFAITLSRRETFLGSAGRRGRGGLDLGDDTPQTPELGGADGPVENRIGGTRRLVSLNHSSAALLGEPNHDLPAVAR